MRIPVVCVVLLGCGASPSPAPVAVGNAVPVKSTAFRASRDMMTREVIRLLSAGDVNTLLGLADIADAFDCSEANEHARDKRDRKLKKTYEKIAVSAVRTKGQAIEVVEITGGRTHEVHAGDEILRCRAKVDLTREEVKVSLRVGGKPTGATLELVKMGGRYYIDDVPRSITAEPGIWSMMSQYADQVCACKDLDCITHAGEAWAKQAAELARDSGDRFTDMTEEDKQRSEEITKKITDCVQKVVPPTP